LRFGVTSGLPHRQRKPTTGKNTVQTVTATDVRTDYDMADVAIRTGHTTTVIHTTAKHPFWDDTTHAWANAADLKRGDKLHALHGPDPVVTSVHAWAQPEVRFDLTLNQVHTFYIVTGAATVLVHNDSCNIGTQIDPLDPNNDLVNAVHNQRISDNARGSSGNYAAARLSDGSIIVSRSGPGSIHSEVNIINAVQSASGNLVIRDLYTERSPCAANCAKKLGGVNVTYGFKWNGTDANDNKAVRARATSDIKTYTKDLFF
jgi:hypothetical protein